MSSADLDVFQPKVTNAPPLVTAMVVHQPGSWFDEVLLALASQDYPTVRNVFFLTTPIINAIPDASAAQLLSRKIEAVLPNAIVRIVEGNPGFGPLINEIQRIVEGDSGFFCVMHDDVALQPSTLRLLVQELFVSNAGVVGPKLVRWNNPALLQSVGYGIDRCGEIDPLIEPNERDQEQHDSVRDIFFVSSACMLVRADIFRELNGFCQEIPFFGEDLEFCWRAHLSGARVIVAPTAVARHRESFSSRAPNMATNGLVARNRARTVATLTSRFKLPIVWLQMLLTSIVETIVGVFSGTFRESLASLRATLLVIVDAEHVWRRRREIRPFRRVAASEISKLQVKGSARVTRFIRHRRALESIALASSNEVKKFWRHSSTRTTGVALVVVFVLIIVGSRGIIINGTRTVGEFMKFDGSSVTPSSLFEMFRSGWWSSGFGQSTANPTGLGLLALGGYLVFGNLAALQTLILVGSLFVGFFGMWRLCGAFANSRARLVGAIIYVGLPLSYDAIARGRFAALLTIAALPWVFDTLRRVGGLQAAQRIDMTTKSLIANSERSDGVGIARRTQLAAGLILILGLVSAFAPALLVITFIGVVLWTIASVFGGTSLRSVGMMLFVGLTGLVGALLINLPWSTHFVSAQWWALLAGDQSVGGRNIGLGSLASLDFGNLRGGFFVFGAYFCVGCAVFIANSWRFVWALRSATLVVGGLLLAVLDDRALLPIELPEPAILLALVACGLGLAGATCTSIFSETALSKSSDWRRSVGLLVPVAIAVSVIPTLLSVVNGRWNQPYSTVSQLLAQLPDNPTVGNYRTLFVGDGEILPVSTNSVTNEISYGVSDDGPVSVVSYWAPQHTEMNTLADHALTALINNDTVRVGRLMSPLAIRYIVVPLGSQPTTSSLRLVDSLSNQLDLRRTYFARDLVIFENVAWIPIVSVLDEQSALASQKVGNQAFIVQELRSVNSLFVDNRSVAVKTSRSRFDGGTIHLSVPFDKRWDLSVDGARIAPRVAFGATTAFDAPVEGIVQLRYKTSSLRYLFLIIQGFVWFGLLILAANLSRLRTRWRGVPNQSVTLIAENSHPVLKLEDEAK